MPQLSHQLLARAPPELLPGLYWAWRLINTQTHYAHILQHKMLQSAPANSHLLIGLQEASRVWKSDVAVQEGME